MGDNERLARMEGKLDAALERGARHDAEVAELRAGYQKLDKIVMGAPPVPGLIAQAAANAKAIEDHTQTHASAKSDIYALAALILTLAGLVLGR